MRANNPATLMAQGELPAQRGYGGQAEAPRQGSARILIRHKGKGLRRAMNMTSFYWLAEFRAHWRYIEPVH